MFSFRCASPDQFRGAPIIDLDPLTLPDISPSPSSSIKTTSPRTTTTSAATSSTPPQHLFPDPGDDNELPDFELPHPLQPPVKSDDDDYDDGEDGDYSYEETFPEEEIARTSISTSPSSSSLRRVEDYVDTSADGRKPVNEDTSGAAISVARRRAELETAKLHLIIAVATIGATIVLVAAIVTAIVCICRRQQSTAAKAAAALKSPPPPPALVPEDGDFDATTTDSRTFIKYKNKNGILYFSTPTAADSTDDVAVVNGYSGTPSPSGILFGRTVSADSGAPGSIQYTTVDGRSCGTPATPASYKTPVYRWEDF